ncbi:TrkH family potassium uptake protein [Mangrovimicrobium sediminis]|nr:TrkH family potassium uptake protein [Haliea sp. SAOS-164]
MSRDASYAILRQPARPAAIAPFLGQLGIALAALTAVPALVALVSGERIMLLRYALIIAGLGLVCVPLSLRPRVGRLQANEGLVITALVFIAPPFLLAWPLMAAGLDYGAALFEAVSGITTTGLSTLASVEQRPPAFLFSRAWLQWIGGLGIAALVPLWLEPGPVARRLAGLEQMAVESHSPAREFAAQILSVYVAVTGIAFALLWLVTGDAFVALLHALAAISTGGFSSYDNSLAALGPAAQLATIAVSTLGAVPLLVFLRGARGSLGGALGDPQLRLLLASGALVALGCTALLVAHSGLAWPAALRHGLVLAFSAQSTAGFSSLDIGMLSDTTKLLLIFAMITGGGIGSTAGGIKLLRVLVFLRTVQFMLRRTRLPAHAWARPRLGGQELDEHLVNNSLALFLLFTVSIMLSWLVFVAAGYPPLDSLFEVVSALATVGLSSGLTASGLPGPLQVVLGVDMLLGRLEIVAVLVLLGPMTWWPRAD